MRSQQVRISNEILYMKILIFSMLNHKLMMIWKKGNQFLRIIGVRRDDSFPSSSTDVVHLLMEMNLELIHQHLQK